MARKGWAREVCVRVRCACEIWLRRARPERIAPEFSRFSHNVCEVNFAQGSVTGAFPELRRKNIPPFSVQQQIPFPLPP